MPIVQKNYSYVVGYYNNNEFIIACRKKPIIELFVNKKAAQEFKKYLKTKLKILKDKRLIIEKTVISLHQKRP